MADAWFVLHWVCAGFSLFAAFAIWRAKKALDLPADSVPGPDDHEWPRVSVVSPCRNEVEEIDSSIRSLLTIDYPNVELIVVDDASTDGTTEKLIALAKEHPSLEFERIDELPEGWLGKCHALHRGSKKATGDWLLFSDGDTSHRSEVLRTAVWHAEKRDLDLVSLLPNNVGMTWFMKATFCYFYAITILSLGMFAWTRRRQTFWSAASGAFILVRRSLYIESGGHESLRLEVVDDMGIAQQVRRSGGRTELLHTDLVDVPWAPDLATLARVTRKNAFAVLRYHWSAVFAATLAVGLVGVVTPLFLYGRYLPASISAWVGILATYLQMRKRAGAYWWSFVLHPAVCLVTTAFMWRSALSISTERGVRWRDRFHPLSELKAWRD